MDLVVFQCEKRVKKQEQRIAEEEEEEEENDGESWEV